MIRALALVACLFLSGCAGDSARKHILAPALQLAWPAVQTDASRGPVALPPDVLDAFNAALRSGDRASLSLLVSTSWPAIFTACQTNIAAMPVSEGVKASEMERLLQFDIAIRKYVER